MKVKSKNNKKPKGENKNKQNHASKDQIEEIEEKETDKIKTIKSKKKVEKVVADETKTVIKSKKRKAENQEEEEKESNEAEVTEEPTSSNDETPKKKSVKKKKKIEDNTPADNNNTENNEEEKPYAYDKADEKKTVFCGNIPNESGISKNKIKELFAQYGKIKSIRMRTETGNILFSKGIKKSCTSFNAYVVFETIEDAKKSLQLNGYKFMENHIRVNLAYDKNSAFKNKGTVFVGNLPFEAKEKEVHDFFGTVGEIEYVRIIPRKGIAYICYKKGVSIVNALKLNDTEFQGRKIRVTRCETKQKQEKKKRYTRDPKTGRRIKLKAKKPHKLNESFIYGRGSKSINNPIIKKIKETQKAKFNKFTDAANQVDKKELFRRGGKKDKDRRDMNRIKMKQKTKFFGSKVDDASGASGQGKKKIKKGKVTKVAKDQKIIAKKLKSAAKRAS